MKKLSEKDYEAGISNTGNTFRIRQLMQRARRGEPVTVAFLGGSITQGSLASRPQNCYAARVTAWLRKTFQQSDITSINAGIGGTTSQFGCARLEQDVLKYEPDFVIVEFSVNDENTPFYQETYEGLIRGILSYRTQPALLLVHNVRYDNGTNAQMQHGEIARHYEIPAVSMQSAIYPHIEDGSVRREEITPDGLHPNDEGHKLVAEIIIYALEKMLHMEMFYMENNANDPSNILPAPLTGNHYEAAVRCQNTDFAAEFQTAGRQQTLADHYYMIRLVKAEGFSMDHSRQSGITDVFKHGWMAWHPGERIVFEIEASEIAVQYRKSVKKPAMSARAVLDGSKSAAVFLDGSFEEDWGDCLYIETLLYHGEYKKHWVEITSEMAGIQPACETVVPFYLASIIISKKS